MKVIRIACIDLGVGYAMTVLFGINMIVIGSRVEITGTGSHVAIQLAGQPVNLTGPVGLI